MRERVNAARSDGSKLREYFVFCNLSQEESLRRVRDRPGHYMKAEMVASQFQDLEVPRPEEERVYVLNVEKNIQEIEKEANEFVKSCLSGDDNR